VLLCLASTNPGKLREFREAAAKRGISVEPVPRIKDLPYCPEESPTFEANAISKALHYNAFVEGPVFADDSGLCVDALGGAPGVYSARYAVPQGPPEPSQGASRAGTGSSPGGTATAHPAFPSSAEVDAANNARLLLELQGVPPDRRAAHYVCAIALAQNGRVLKVTRGCVVGLIAETPRGSRGFGYDPYFFFPPLGKTFAELSAEDKFAVSHRGQAFRKLLDYLTG
jgi:XTP/dITP diphosphohydrolase